VLKNTAGLIAIAKHSVEIIVNIADCWNEGLADKSVQGKGCMQKTDFVEGSMRLNPQLYSKILIRNI
jgi:hypothetical protein